MKDEQGGSHKPKKRKRNETKTAFERKKIYSCICARTDSFAGEKWIACDVTDCQIVWYHISCVGLAPESLPEQGWACPSCEESQIDKEMDFENECEAIGDEFGNDLE